MIPKLFYPALFGCIATMGFAAWLITSRIRRHYSPYVELTAQMRKAEDVFDEIVDAHKRDYIYSANQNEGGDRYSHAEAAAFTEASARASTSVHRRCPRCGSDHVKRRNQARKAGSTIGAVAGATSGVAMTLSGAEVGATVGLMAGPIGSVFGGLAGAILAGLAASAAGCAAGAAMGEVIDENVLDNHRCSACGHTFNASA